MGSGQHSDSDQTSRVGAPIVSEVSAPPLAWASPKVPPHFLTPALLSWRRNSSPVSPVKMKVHLRM